MALDTFNPYLFVSAGEQSNKFLTPVISPEGVATFQAQRAQPLTKLIVQIDSVQEGTGDPSPTNVRPISGRTGMTVTRAGVNLLNWESTSKTINGVTFTVNSDGTVKADGTATADASLYATASTNTWLKAGAYVINGCPSGGSITTYEINETSKGAHDTGGGATFTMPDDGYVRVRIVIRNGYTANNLLFKPMIRPASISDDTFVPYAGTTIPITWETEAGTVYGGTLDVVSGVLTVDKKLHTVSDVDSTTLYQSGPNANRIGIIVGDSKTSPTVEDRLNIVCNIAKADTSILTQSVQAVGTCCLYSGGTATYSNALFGVPTTEDTAEKAKAWLITQGCTFVYPLATPQTYQLDPEQVQTIAGYNQVYSDAGPVIDIKF